MSDNEATIRRFYEALGRRDADTMAACYAPDVRFSDPAFPDLRGDEAGDMWRMLAERGKDLQVTFRDVRADESAGSAHWDATYTFSATKRRVINRIDASFRFRDGRIVEHTDRFDFWAWSRQALGAPGLLLGWSGFLQRKVQAQAAQGLRDWRSKRRGLPCRRIS